MRTWFITDPDLEKGHPLFMLLFSVISEIVNTPNSVELMLISEEMEDTFYIKPLETEMGQLIGSSGYVANSIRNLMKCAAKRRRIRPIRVEIVSNFDNIS